MMFGWMKKGKKTEKDDVGYEPPAASAAPGGGGDDLFAGMEVPSGDDLFGGMTVGDTGAAGAAPPAADTVPAPRKSSGFHPGAMSKFQPAASEPKKAMAAPVAAPVPPPAPAPPAPKPVPVSADPTVNYHNQLDAAMKKLIGDFEQASKEELGTRSKLTTLETTKQEIRDNLLKCESQQSEALQTEDYETAEKMTKQIDTFRSQLGALDLQKERGLSRLGDLRKKLGEKIEMFSTVLDKVNGSLSQLVQSKDTYLNQKKDSHAREFTTLEKQYHEYQGRADDAERMCSEKREEANHQMKAIEDKIYEETKTDSDNREAQQQRKEALDTEIADLEAKLRELQSERAGCLKTIAECDKSIGAVRKNYTKDMLPIQQLLKKLDDETARIQKDQKTATKMKDNMDSRKIEFDIEEEELGKELSQLTSEHESLESSVSVSRQLYGKYVTFSTNAGPESLKSLKQELETRRHTIADEAQKHQTIDQEIEKKKEEVQKLDASIPGWEENKKKAIAGKNFAIAGKMSAQIKKAQTDIDELKKDIEQKEADVLQFDAKMNKLNREVDQLQTELEREERLFDSTLISYLQEIVNIIENGKSDLECREFLSDIFKSGFTAFYECFQGCFQEVLSKLEERIANAPPLPPPAPASAAFVPGATPEPEPQETPKEEKPAVVLSEEEKDAIRTKITDLENTLAGLQLEEKFEECEEVQKQIDELQLQL